MASKRFAALAAATLAWAAVASAPTKRYLPPGALNMAYSPGCNRTRSILAAQSGINVFFWFQINLIKDSATNQPAVQEGLDFDCIANVSLTLRQMNLPTTHMVTIGGWDAPHPDTSFPPAEMYAAWKGWNEQTVARPGLERGFDGVDWDLEGFDNASDPNNVFTVECLDLVGQFSQMAKADGYVVSLVPPESYLDPTTSLYDRSLLHAYPEWHPEFQYHGHNPYALLVSKYGNTSVPGADGANATALTFDFVSIQLYESWSHADYNVTQAGQTAADYLTAWVPRVTGGWWVDFASDPASAWPSCVVSLAPSQLVIGLANGWAGGPKAILIMPQDVGTAWAALTAAGQAPRGTVFWDLSDEGDVPAGQSAPLYMAAGINAFLHTRNASTA